MRRYAFAIAPLLAAAVRGGTYVVRKYSTGGAGSPVWNNDGDAIVVRDDRGEVVLREEY